MSVQFLYDIHTHDNLKYFTLKNSISEEMITTLHQDGLSENQPKKFDIQQLLNSKYSNKNLYTLHIKQTETEIIQTRKWENTLGKTKPRLEIYIQIIVRNNN